MAVKYAVFNEKNQRRAWDEHGVGRILYGVDKGGQNIGGYWASPDASAIQILMDGIKPNPHRPEIWIYVRD